MAWRRGRSAGKACVAVRDADAYMWECRGDGVVVSTAANMTCKSSERLLAVTAAARTLSCGDAKMRDGCI
jgi:hypothetical protein